MPNSYFIEGAEGYLSEVTVPDSSADSKLHLEIADLAARDAISNAITTAGTGLSKSGTTLNHSNSVTAGTVGTSSATSGSSLSVPYVTYDEQGHVTASGVHTHTITGFASSSHSHGDITSGGDITTTATIASGDRLVINDESASKVTNSSITFGSSASKYLANDGTWQDTYTKSEIDSKVASVFRYKGSKATTSQLPSSGNTTGDVWHVDADGSEWAWDGSNWQELGTATSSSHWVDGVAAGSVRSSTAPAEGTYSGQTYSLGTGAVAEGLGFASGNYSHAEGEATAQGNYSHAEGIYYTHAQGDYSHAENNSQAIGHYSHSEGYSSARGNYSHSEGFSTNANFEGSHTEGYSIFADHCYQHVSGRYNEYTAWESGDSGPTDYYGDISSPLSAESIYKGPHVYNAEVIGGGTGNNQRRNIRTLDWDGCEYVYGHYRQGNLGITLSETSTQSGNFFDSNRVTSFAHFCTKYVVDGISFASGTTPQIVTPATVVTGGTTTNIPNVSSKTVVTSASGATSSYENGVVTFTDGSFSTGDSVTTGTAIAAYTSLTTGASATVTAGTAPDLVFSTAKVLRFSDAFVINSEID